MTPPDSRAEFQLLCLAAQPSRTPWQDERLQQLIDDGPDWALIQSLSTRHWVDPLLFAALKRRPRVPAKFLDSLETSLRESLISNLKLLAELQRILAIFAEEEIDALVVKGPALAIDAYQSLSLRSYLDVDVVVHRENASRAFARLEQAGMSPYFPVTGGRVCRFISRFTELSFWSSATETSVDLHWALVESKFSFAPSPNRIWTGLRTLRVDPCLMTTLSEPETLRYLCIHAAKHQWERLQWLADVAAWLRHHPDVDWEEVGSDTSSLRFIAVTLLLIERFFAIPLPPPMRRHVEKDPRCEALVTEVAQRIESPEPPPGRRQLWGSLYCRAMSSPSDRRRWVCSHLFLPSVNEWLLVPLPRSLEWMYSIIRPFRLAYRWLTRRPGEDDSA